MRNTRKNQSGFAVRTVTMAVHGALLAMAIAPVAYAGDEPTAAELTKPAQSVEIGVQSVSKGSFKAGEYNGLEKNGATAILNFDLRGGGQYDSEDVTRWRIQGADLGLETSNLTGEYSQQGKFKINFGYDQLLRNRSDSYMTPYIGAGSGNVLTLPGTWLKPQVNGAASALGFSQANIDSQVWKSGFLMGPGYATGYAPGTSSAAQIAADAAAVTNKAASNAAIAADVPLFHNVNLSTKRSKTDVGMSFNIDTQWQINASVRSEEKKGYKPLSTVSAANLEIATVLPDKIDTVTDQFNLSLGYTGDKSFLKAAYYGSLFKNNVNSMTWYDWSAASPGAQPFTMSSAPSNQFHQFSLSGGYYFDKNTKLVTDVSYARNTQNDQYLKAGQLGVIEQGMGLPTNSLDGLVVTKAFNMKLTSKPVKDWNFGANYKFDNRDNRTAVNTYLMADAGLTLPTAAPVAAAALWNASMIGWIPTSGYDSVTGNIATAPNILANRPYSKKVNQLNLDATYSGIKGQSIKVGYDWQKIDRYCNGSWIDCADAATTKENTVRADWRGKLTENLTAKTGIALSQRKVDSYNENAFLAVVPMAQYAPTATNVTANGTGVGGSGGLSFYQTLQVFGLTGFGLNTGYLTNAQLTALYPTATVAQLAALKYYFGSAATTNGTGPGGNTLYANRNRISELIGMRRFNMANRDRDVLKVGADWQASDKLSMQGSLNYKNDKYSDSIYGLTAGKNWGLNLDAAYEADENLNLGAFFNYEDRSSSMSSDAFGTNSLTTLAGTGSTTGTADSLSTTCSGPVTDINSKNLNAKIDPCLKWSADMHDKVDTLGLTLKNKNLMHGKLDIASALTFTRATTDTSVTGGSYVASPATAGGVPIAGQYASYWLPAQALPTVTIDTIELKVNGKYKIDKASTVHVGYSYSYMKNVDYAYNALQMAGSNSNVLPTNEQAPNYTVQVIGASYIHSF